MTNRTPSGMKEHRQTIKPEMAKMLSSSDRLIEDYATVLGQFWTKQQHFTLSSAPAHRFLHFYHLHKALSNEA